jgi:peptidoglycan/xylan/chitin deacetylase (PgdA/CDA1 family)
MCVRPDNLAQHLEVLVRRTRPVSLHTLASVPRGQPGRRDLAVTFDDAYTDVLEVALPILERFEVPATVFVVTGALGASFWWDRLTALLWAAPPSRVTVTLPAAAGLPKRQIAVNSRRLPPAALGDVLRVSPDVVRKQVLDDLQEALGLAAVPDPAPMARAVTSEELLRLAAHPLITIGAHTFSHPDLSRVERSRLEREVLGSRRSLGDLIGADIDAFAYPHGLSSGEARAMVTRAGFTMACAGHPGRVRRHTDRLTLPRLWPSDVDGDGFGRFLRLWTGA